MNWVKAPLTAQDVPEPSGAVRQGTIVEVLNEATEQLSHDQCA